MLQLLLYLVKKSCWQVQSRDLVYGSGVSCFVEGSDVGVWYELLAESEAQLED